jgi:predicted dehydrogenase
MLRIGIIGMGFMGRTHCEAYQKIPGVKVTAIADLDPRRAAGDLSGSAGNIQTGGLTQLPMNEIRGTQNFADLLDATDLDIIDVCTPTPLHVQMVTRALAAGKHVLSEKPLARSIADGQRIAEAAAAAKTFHMPAMCMRFWPQWAWLKEVVADGRYGKVLSATFRRVTSPLTGWFLDAKQCGGAILDLHIHDTDFVNYLFGPPPKVFSRGYKKVTGEVDHIVTNYLYDNVPLVVAEGSWALQTGFGFRMQYTVNFENATADFDLARDEPLHVIQNGQKTAIVCAPEAGYDLELRYFINCVQTNQRPTIVTAADGLVALKIIDAENRSVAQQAPVPVTL